MLREVLGIMLKSEVADLKRRGVGGGLLLASVAVLALAGTAGLLALYLWLGRHMQPWQAALIISGGLVIIALILMLTGRSMMRRKKVRSTELDDIAAALMGKQSAGKKGDDGQSHAPLGAVATAAVVGVLIGRQLRR